MNDKQSSNFDWVQFHHELDMALAQYLSEAGGYLSDNLLEFITYSNNMRLASTVGEDL